VPGPAQQSGHVVDKEQPEDCDYRVDAGRRLVDVRDIGALEGRLVQSGLGGPGAGHGDEAGADVDAGHPTGGADGPGGG